MKDLPIELIYILLFGAILLFNFVMQQRAAKRKQLEAAKEEPLPEEIDEDVWERAPLTASALPEAAVGVAPMHRAALPNPSPAPRSRRFARRSLFGARRAVQDAFVVAAILGRCRADEPHDSR